MIALLALALAGDLPMAPVYEPDADDCPDIVWTLGERVDALDTLDQRGLAACNGILIGDREHLYLTTSEADSQYMRERYAREVEGMAAALAEARRDRRRAWWRGASTGAVVGGALVGALVVGLVVGT